MQFTEEEILRALCAVARVAPNQSFQRTAFGSR
jgi:hypothetical protein